MRKVVSYVLLSLDGVVFEDSSEWPFESDPAVFENLARVIEPQDDILLGRNTYDYWVGYWPHVEPSSRSRASSTPRRSTSFSSTTPSPEWAHSTLVTGSAVDYVTELKQRPGGDIGLHGSIRLTQSLSRAGLVDEFRLVISPAIAGQGRRLFEGKDDLRTLGLVDVARSPTGSVFLAYRLDATSGPRGARSPPPARRPGRASRGGSRDARSGRGHRRRRRR